MPSFPHSYGDTEGPLGFPMLDRQARDLDALLKALPSTDEYRYRHLVTTRAPTELNPGERSDVSWITTESVDRTGEVVRARGMNDGQFQANPLVTLGHSYSLPPVGRSLWRRRVKDGERQGVKAKTVYPARPETWPDGEKWAPDQVFALVQAGLLNGKSIGFLPTKVHIPDEAEVKTNNWSEQVSLVIDEWLLLEYACVFLPTNQDALVEAVSKGAVDLSPQLLRAIGLTDLSIPSPILAFTPFEEVENAIRRRIESLDVEALARRAVADAFDRARGRI
jgi:hypothetical protein